MLSRALNSGKAGLVLAAAGDWTALARRLREAVTGERPPLPAGLAPLPRPAGPSAPAPTPDSPQLLMISPHLRRDGAPMSQLELARGLADRGWRLLCASPSEGPLGEAYRAAGIRIECWPELTARSATPAWYEEDAAALAARLRALNPAVVYANTLDAFPAIDAARIAGLPSLWNIREGEDWRLRLADRHTHVAARALAAFSYPESVVFVARAAANAWSDFTPAERRRVVYNAPASLASGSPTLRATNDSFNILSVGVLCERKGQIDLIEALGQLDPGLRKTVRVTFIGRDHEGYRARMELRLAPELANQAAFAGETDGIAGALAGADLLVHTARAEAFPRVFLEAAAADVPIVATRVGGAAERLEDGTSALLYEAGDTAALARQIARAADPGLRAKLAAAARAALVEGWTFADMIGAYEGGLRSAGRGRLPETRGLA